MELCWLYNIGGSIFGVDISNASPTTQLSLICIYMEDTSNMLTRSAIALQSFHFTVEHKPGKLHVVPDTSSRLFGNVSEDTTVKTSSVSDVLQSQPKLASHLS